MSIMPASFRFANFNRSIKKTAFFGLFLLSACGGGGGDSTSGGGSGTQPSPSPSSPAPILETGRFIDSPVEGIEFQTQSQSGFTNANGEFQFRSGETVVFKIGSLIIGQSNAKGVVTPIDLVPGADADNSPESNPQVVKILQILQTLDSDGDPGNGISISQETRDASEEIFDPDTNFQVIDLTSSPQIEAWVLESTGDTEIVSVEEAVNEFRVSLDEIEGDTLTLGGSLVGLETNEQISISLNQNEILTLDSNGSFNFVDKFSEGDDYAVVILDQPEVTQCEISNSNGVFSSLNIANLDLICVRPQFSVGGTVTGLNGALVLDLGSETLQVSSNGAFTFASILPVGTFYSASIIEQPVNQTCTISGAQGVVSQSDVTSISVSCTENTYALGGAVLGLNGSVVLQNGDDIVTLTSAGNFTFPRQLISGSTYSVLVQTQPTGQVCVVNNAVGSVGSADINNLEVNCNDSEFTVGGTVSGLEAGEQVSLSLNGGAQSLQLSENGEFSFDSTLNFGEPYLVEVSDSSISTQCSIANGQGIDIQSDISDISVICDENSFVLGGQISGLIGDLILTVGVEEKTFTANDNFSFDQRIIAGEDFDVQVQVQPASQFCTVENGQGTMPENDLLTIQVSCSNNFSLSGQVTGLVGDITLNAHVCFEEDCGALSPVESIQIQGTSLFEFSSRFPGNANYFLSIDGNDECEFLSGQSGTNVVANINDINISCSSNTSTVSISATSYLSGEVIVQLVNENGEVAASQALSFNVPKINKDYLFGANGEDGAVDRNFETSGVSDFAIEPIELEDVAQGTYDVRINTNDLVPAFTLNEQDYSADENVGNLIDSGLAGGNATAITCSQFDSNGEPVEAPLVVGSVSETISIFCGTPTSKIEFESETGSPRAPDEAEPLLEGTDLLSACIGNQDVTQSPKAFANKLSFIEQMPLSLSDSADPGVELNCGCWQAEQYTSRNTGSWPGFCNEGVLADEKPAPTETPVIHLPLWSYLVEMDVLQSISLIGNQLGDNDIRLLHAPYLQFADSTQLAFYIETPTTKLSKLDLNLNSFNNSELWVNLWKISSNLNFVVPNSLNFGDRIVEDAYALAIRVILDQGTDSVGVTVEGNVPDDSTEPGYQSFTQTFETSATKFFGTFSEDADLHDSCAVHSINAEDFPSELCSNRLALRIPFGTQCEIPNLLSGLNALELERERPFYDLYWSDVSPLVDETSTELEVTITGTESGQAVDVILFPGLVHAVVATSGASSQGVRDFSNTITINCSLIGRSTIGGTVSGLEGEITLQNGAEQIVINENGPFSFDDAQPIGTEYNVSIITQPELQVCQVENEQGLVGEEDVTSILVDCDNLFNLSGTIIGASAAVEISDGALTQEFLSGPFQWPNTFLENANYSLQVTAPEGQQCSPAQLSGTFSAANISNANIQCEPLYAVSVSIEGNTGPVTVEDSVSGESITFSGDATDLLLLSGLKNTTEFSLTVSDEPATQSCEITNNSVGTIGGSDIEATVECETLDNFTLGGSVTGHVGELRLCSNASTNCESGQSVTVEGSSSFAFPQTLPEGTAYQLTLLSDNSECVATGSGSITQNTNDLSVVCNEGETSSVSVNLQSFLKGSLSLSLRRRTDNALASTIVIRNENRPAFDKTYIYGTDQTPGAISNDFSDTKSVVEFTNIPDGEYELVWDSSDLHPAVTLAEDGDFGDHPEIQNLVDWEEGEGDRTKSTAVACLADGELAPVSVNVSANVTLSEALVCGTSTTPIDLSDRDNLPNPLLDGTDLFSACLANADLSGQFFFNGNSVEVYQAYFVETFFTGLETGELENGVDVGCSCWRSENYTARAEEPFGPFLACGSGNLGEQNPGNLDSTIINLPLWEYLVSMDMLKSLNLSVNQLGNNDLRLLHAPYIKYSTSSDSTNFYTASPTSKLERLDLNLNGFDTASLWAELWKISTATKFNIPNSKNFNNFQDGPYAIQVDMEFESGLDTNVVLNLNGHVSLDKDRVDREKLFTGSESHVFDAFVNDTDLTEQQESNGDVLLLKLDMQFEAPEGIDCIFPNLHDGIDRASLSLDVSPGEDANYAIDHNTNEGLVRVRGQGTGVRVPIQLFPGIENAIVASSTEPEITIRNFENAINIRCERAPEFTLGGAVSGLEGEVQLTFGDETITVTEESYIFETGLLDGDAYSVGVATHPENQFCELENASGTVNFSNVENINVSCETYKSISGTFTGTSGPIQIDGQTFSGGTFTLSSQFRAGENYSFAVGEPAGLQCSPLSFNGIVSDDDIANLAIQCEPLYSLSVDVSGLDGSLTIDQTQPQTSTHIVSANGITLLNEVALRNNDAYVIGIIDEPEGQSCSITPMNTASGIISGSDIVVDVTCSDLPRYTIAGNVEGLVGSLTLCSNASANCSTGQSVTVEGVSSFQFPSDFVSGTNYAITPVNLDTNNCPDFSVNNGSGVLENNVSNLTVSCSDSGLFSIGGTAQIFLNGIVEIDLVRSSDGALAASTTINATSVPAMDKSYIESEGVIDGDFAATKFVYAFDDVPPGTYDVEWNTNLLSPAVTISESDYEGHDDIIALLASQTSLSTAVGCVSDDADSILLAGADLEDIDIRCGTPTVQKDLFELDGDGQITPDLDFADLASGLPSPVLDGTELFSSCLSNTRLSLNPPFGGPLDAFTRRRDFLLVEDLIPLLTEPALSDGFDLFCGCWRTESFGDRGFTLPYLPLESECNTGISSNPFSEFFTPEPDSPAIDLALWSYLVEMDLFTGIALFANQLGNDDLKLIHAPYLKYISSDDEAAVSGPYLNSPTSKLEELDLNMNSFSDSSLWLDLWRISSNVLYNVQSSHNFSDSSDDPYVISILANFEAGVSGVLTVEVEGPTSTISNSPERSVRSHNYTMDGEIATFGIFVDDPDVGGGLAPIMFLELFITQLPPSSMCTLNVLNPDDPEDGTFVDIEIIEAVNLDDPSAEPLVSLIGPFYSSIPIIFSGNSVSPQPPIQITCSAIGGG